jgi:hypothetical protein
MIESRPSIPRAAGAITLVLSTYLVTLFLVLAAAVWMEVTPPEIPRLGIPLFVAVLLGVPLIVAAVLGRVFRRKGWLPRINLRGHVAMTIGALYTLTVVFGLPAVQTYENSWAVEEYKRDKASGNARVWATHPYIATYFAAPVLPGLVLTYHEYQLDGLYGFGGFELFGWYGIGVAPVAHLPLWLS